MCFSIPFVNTSLNNPYITTPIDHTTCLTHHTPNHIPNTLLTPPQILYLKLHNSEPTFRTLSRLHNPNPMPRCLSSVHNPNPMPRCLSSVHNPNPMPRCLSSVHNPNPMPRCLSRISGRLCIRRSCCRSCSSRRIYGGRIS